MAAELELLAGSDDAAVELAGATELVPVEEGASELSVIDDSAAEDAGADETDGLELLTGLELPPPPPQAVSPIAIRERHKTR